MILIESFEFHQISVGVRPTRAAVRMGQYEGWEHSAVRVLEVLSITWGGAGDIIVTCDSDGVTNGQLWSVVELFDPDIWASHTPTHRGWLLRDPAGYHNYLDAQTDVSLPEGTDREEWKSQIHRMLMSEGSLSGWVPPEPFWERTRTHLAPSWDREHGHAELVRDDEAPTGALVDVTKLTPLPQRVVVPYTGNLQASARVLVASKWGALSPSSRAALTERGVPVVDVPVVEADLPGILAACWGASMWPTPALDAELADAISPEILGEAKGSAAYWFDTYGPFAMSMVGLGEFIRLTPMRQEWPLVIVVGDSASDFALATSLDRCMGPAMWVPPAILGEETWKVAARVLEMPRRHDDRDRPVYLTSCSLNDDAIQAMAGELADQMWSNASRVRAGIPELPQQRPVSILDAQLGFTNEDELFSGNATGRGIRARLPSSVGAKDPFDLSWWNDVVRVDHQLPPRWPLNEHVVARSGSWKSRARVTREGLAFHSKPLGFLPAGVRLEQIVDNPRLRFLDSATAFKTIAAEAGITLTESPAGRYTARVTELWGGLAALTTDLQRPIVRRVLDAFQSTAKSGVDPGNMIADRRYLSFEDLETTAGDLNALFTFVDWSVRTGVLRRGLCLACSQCSHFGWYDADDIGQEFQCWRCRTQTTIDSRAIRGGTTEPDWYYSLAEVVYQACRASFNVPVLALHQFAGDARSVLGMTDHEITFADHQRVEIDLWGIVDGCIVLGEAKTGKELGKSARARRVKAQRLRRAADAITADVFVLATASNAWAPSSVEAIEEAFKDSRCEIQYVHEVDPHLTAANIAK
jgi:hypothetical protein